MMRGTTKRIITKTMIIFIWMSFFLFGGCQRIWYFTITDVSDPNHPHFCFSRSKNCRGSAIRFSLLDITEVNTHDEEIQDMWILEPETGSEIHRVMYGTVPQGFKEIAPALPLEIGKFYRVHGQFFFRLVQNGKIVESEVYSHKEFYKKFVYPSKPEKRKEGKSSGRQTIYQNHSSIENS